MWPPYRTDAQLRAELERCWSCEARPCRSGCPAGCSPADFILAARCGEPSDYRRAAAHVLAHNPLGGVCGSVCPDSLCMARCARRSFDAPVNVPAVQAAIVRRARELGPLPRPEPAPATGQRVAVVGAGPAGLGAAGVLARAGHTVHVFDRARRAGGMARLVPRERLDPAVLAADVAGLLELGDVRLVLGRPVALPRDLLARGYAAVIVAAGLAEPVELDVPGEERALGWAEVLGARPPPLGGRRVAVVGDGGVAVDCVEAALAQGAAHVELFARRTISELGLSRRDRDRLLASGAHVSCRVRVAAIRGRGARVTALVLRKVTLPAGQAFHPSRLADLRGGEHVRRDLDAVILALGGRPALRLEPHPRVFYAGDLESGPTTVVEALASGKRAALAVHALLGGDEVAACPDRTTCADGSGCPKRATCPEWSRPASVDGPPRPARAAAGLPVDLGAQLFGRPVRSPLLLARGPHTLGYAQLRRAYEAGWAGGVMAPARDAAALDRSCADVERLGREFPDRLTIASAAGPVTGDDEADALAFGALVRRLDAAGAMAVEVELAPGAEERIAEWVLAAGDPRVPRLFRIPAAAATAPALARVAAALARHPGKSAGVTLAGGDPDLALARAARLGLVPCVDGGSMDYRAAASLLALGARAVQLSDVVTRYGLRVASELHGGLSHLLAARGLRSVAELVGSGLAAPGAPGGGLAPGEAICEVDPARCAGCGNCARCPHVALAPGPGGPPIVDAARCAGCGLCVGRCPAGALALRRRA